MGALAKLTVGAVAAAVMLAGCGGGGGTSTQPSVPSQTVPTVASSTPVGTAILTLAFPKVVTAKKANSVTRSPQYVNPIVTAGGPCAGENLLDIYVDGTLQPLLDAGPEVGHSLCVTGTSGNGTQTANLPLYSFNGNQIVVVEWDPTDTSVLALGETDLGGFTAGVAQPITLTMMMNAQAVGITNLSFSDPQEMASQAYGATDFTCIGGVPAAQFGVYTADSTGTFVTTAGALGTSTATATGTPVLGTSSVGQTAVAGIYNIAWDGSCNDVNVSATASNPAYAIYNSVANLFDSSTYPGIYHLRWISFIFAGWFGQLNHSTVSGTVVVHNSTL